MSLHPGMKFRFIKGKAKGRVGKVIAVHGNEILVKTRKSRYWANKKRLDEKVRWYR